MIANPEIFREWQYARYMESCEAEDEEPAVCALCGEAMEAVCADRPGYAGSICLECAECEAEETGCGLAQALANLAERFGLQTTEKG